MTVARALTIAGSDSGGGAGIQQDLKTFHAFGVWGMTAITAVTVQNTVEVRSWEPMSPAMVAAQIDAVASDIGVDAAKTGMLGSAEVVQAVARTVRDAGILRLVVDPVMVATSGDSLAERDVVAALVRELVPLAALMTPNAHEASVLTDVEVRDRASQREAARALLARGVRAVLVKGGDVADALAVDVLADENGIEEVSAPRVDTAHTHGTGCMLSAAIVARLAQGASLREAVGDAKAFVTGALSHGLRLGAGRGPVNPMWEQRAPR